MGAYDRDFHAWAMEQAELIRRRSANEIDWENVAEEIESLGRQERSELRNRLTVLLAHLLKWEFQSSHRGRSWNNTISIQRRASRRHLAENPSLKSIQADLFAEAYETAREEASTETELDLETFPLAPPFTLEQALDPDWLPGASDRDQSSTASNGS